MVHHGVVWHSLSWAARVRAGCDPAGCVKLSPLRPAKDIWQHAPGEKFHENLEVQQNHHVKGEGKWHNQQKRNLTFWLSG